MSKFKNRSGEKYNTKEGYEVVITEYSNALNCTIKFTHNGLILPNKHFSEVKNGSIKNPFHPSVCGIGFIGMGKYKSSFNYIIDKSYNIWVGMIKRCYDKKRQEKQSSYKGVTVCEEWHNFQNFAKWFEENYIEDFHLDKDILQKGNKIYSPETCCFVHQEINQTLVNRRISRGEYPIGVHLQKSSGYYIAQIRKNNDVIYLGLFNTVYKAFQAYKTAKELWIKKMANKWRDKLIPSVYQALYNYKIEITD